jgi:hypothetical protein
MKANLLVSRLCCFGLLAVSGINAQRMFGQSNIVVNNSFELADSYWGFDGMLGVEMNKGAAQGTNYLTVFRNLYQNLETIPGRDYVLQFAVKTFVPQVQWGDQVFESFTNLPSGGGAWHYVYCYLKASNSVTRLTFVNVNAPDWFGTAVDDVLVGWLQEPITILAQPQSQSVIEGGRANFVVRALGAPPLSYQWFFEGERIGWGTERVLSLQDLRPSQAGQYSVLVSNLYSARVSSNAVLQVDQLPSAPVIVYQPSSQTLPAGYGYAMTVIALGQRPLKYQWRFNGADRPGATNSSLVFESVGDVDAGAYSVFVWNSHGSVLSLPATLVVTHAAGGGYVSMENRLVNAPVFDTDATTLLTGSNCICQLYVGASREMLRPVGQPKAFYPSNIFTYAGCIAGNFLYQAPDVAVGQTANLQLRVWERLVGSSYEEGRALGGKFGVSDIFQFTAQGYPPGGVRGPMRSFSLRTGLPLFTTGKLASGGPLPDGTRQWILTGEPGFRYLVEKRQPPHDWEPLLILTNTTGTVTFSDPDDPNRPFNFYRSRMLD